MDDDLFQRAKRRIDELKELNRDQHRRFNEDLRFSNPAEPQQWDVRDREARDGRPVLTLDRTNQFIQQVSNDIRQNNNGIEVICADDEADPKAAQVLEDKIRHIEYESRAPVAYDMMGDHQARCGQGWTRVVPIELPGGDGELDLRIMRVTDPTSAGLDPDCQEPDGFGAKWGYIETRMSEAAFKAAYPKAAQVPIGDSTWNTDGFVTIAEYFEVMDEDDSEPADEDDTEDEDNVEPDEADDSSQGRVRWIKLSGAEILEKTRHPGTMVPLVPAVGYELWVEGKRYLCGLTRRLMDAQRLHNVRMSAMAESLGNQPKAPFLTAAEAIAGYEPVWESLNGGNPSVLIYNHLDESGNPIPPPSRLSPPAMPVADAQMAQFATEEMQASVGMYKANLGQQDNATSGIAIRSRKMEGDVATFHFPDNHSRSIAQLGRIIVDAIPYVYTKDRLHHTVGLNGERKSVKFSPSMRRSVRADKSGKVVAINPKKGRYGVIVKAGPSYTTQREETSDQLAQMISQNPALAPVLGPMWARMKESPYSDKIAKLLLAMAPPAVQQMEADEHDIPPQVAAQLQQSEAQMQKMHQLIDMASQKIMELQKQAEDKHTENLAKVAELRIDQYNAETNRLKVLGGGMTSEQVQAMVAQMIQDVFATPMTGQADTVGQIDMPAPQDMQMAPPPEQQQLPSNQPPQGGFSLPEGQQ